MTAKIIIDGWNVCWKLPEISKYIPDNLERARAQFNHIIKYYFYRKKVKYTIFYDGQPLIYSQKRSDESIQFSSDPEKADDLILKFLQKQSVRKEWTVITSDRQLSARVKDLGAYTLSSESFIVKLRKTNIQKKNNDFRSDPKVNDEDISYWLNKFESKD